MRPTIDEQLRGLRTVLTATVAPEVVALYPSDLLATVVTALERLEGEWGAVLAAMRDESAALDALLVDARARVDATLRVGIDAASAGPHPDWLDPAAARRYYETRRGLLAEVVREIGAGPAVVAHLRAHLAGPL